MSLACVFVFRFIAKSAGMEVRVGMARVNGRKEWRVLFRGVVFFGTLTYSRFFRYVVVILCHPRTHRTPSHTPARVHNTHLNNVQIGAWASFAVLELSPDPYKSPLWAKAVQAWEVVVYVLMKTIAYA